MSQRKGAIASVARWALALATLAFVAWIVPVRDHCADPAAPATTRVPVSRHAGTAGACTLHLRTGPVVITETECSKLVCDPGLASTLAHARPDVLALLLGLYALGSLAWAARWRTLLGLTGIRLPLARVWRVSTEAQAGGILLPGGIGGDALRITYVAGLPRTSETHSPVSIAVASVLVDRVVGLAVLAGTAAALAFASGGVRAGPLAATLAGLPLAFVAGVLVVRHSPLGRVPWLIEGRISRIAAPLLDYARHPRAPRALAVAAAWSVLVACAQFTIVRGLVFAVGGVPTAEKWVYVGTAMAFVVSALPTLPGAWGTADAAYVFFFGLAGLRPGTALAVCLLYRLFWYVLAIAGAVLHLARARHSTVTAGGEAVDPKE